MLNDFGARVAGAALQRMGAYMRLKRRFASVEELEQHFRTIHEPFGKLTDAQWRHLAEHSRGEDDARATTASTTTRPSAATSPGR